MSEWWPGVSLPRFAISTVVAYSLECALFYPFDIIKVRQQVGSSPGVGLLAPIVGTGRTMIAEAGWAGLFRGYPFACISGIPSQLVYIPIYNVTLNNLRRIHSGVGDDSDSDGVFRKYFPRMLLPAAAGIVGDVSSIAVTVPPDIITQRIQAGDGGAKGNFWVVVQNIFKKKGLSGFYLGTGATLLTQIPGGCVWWVTYEGFKDYLLTVLPSTDGPVSSAHAIAGAFAGGTSAIVTNPIDVCKTRIQTNRLCYGATSTMKVLLAAVRHEGIAVLSSGLVVRMLTFVPYSLVHSCFYETTLYFSRADRHFENAIE